MILCDAGPIVAILNVNDPLHRECVRVAQNLPDEPLVTSLVALAESIGERRIFTLDSDFYVYRLYDSETFAVIMPDRG